jgi:hypothetical protein
MHPLKIEVLGNAKTGTTGVFNSIRLPLRERDPGTLLLFEPRSSSLYRLARHDVPFSVLVKAMINKNGMKIAYEGFTHHVLISRDPRDTLVSQLLYLPLQPHGVRKAGPEKLQQMIDLLQEKEADPASHSFQEVFETGIALMDRDKQWTWEKYLDRFLVAERLAEAYDCFPLKYEDFTDNRLDALSDYVGLPIEPVLPKNVDELNGHVVRSASHGDWPHWFTPSDIDFFRPRFKSYMDAFGYDDDWSLAPNPVISHETASGYILGRRPVVEAKMARRFQKQEEWTTHSVTDAAGAEAIRTIAEDTDAALHGFRYASLLLEGRVVPRDPPRAFGYAYRSALIGHLPAMELVEKMFREGIGTTQDLERAGVWAQEAEVLKADPELAPKPKPAPRPAPAAGTAKNTAAGTASRPRAVAQKPKAPPPSLARRVVRKLKKVAARRRRTGPRTGAS